ncbi:alpha/beta hydrolase family protein [Shouchella shacheensis]|uniref:alpha/beta hydrolase family protein n=1 Tax=Shouchella shacheensis TaxID=1649580 RepID=UPI0007400149|nr:alpha/beta hydrolase [Shouchella shacheensis]
MNLDGYWEGKIVVSNQQLPIIVEFEEEDGKLSIPIQGLNDYPLSLVKVDDSSVFFEMDIQGDIVTFEGQFEEEKITGTFTQQAQSFPFKLMKGNLDNASELVDKDLTEIEVSDGVMKGKVETPEGQGPFPVAIIIAGSGPTDKDGNSKALPGENNSLKMIAEGLTSEGIASIRYDKRGVGDNMILGGNEEDLRFDDYIDDAVAWMTYAENSDLFSSVSVIGHSEGSLIGMVASYQEDANTFVSLAGAGRQADDVLHEQLETQLSGDLLKEAKEILDNLKRGETVKNISSELQSIFRPSVQPYMMSWMEYDPRQEMAKLDSPILIVNGTRDLQVPVSEAEILYNAKPNSEFLIIEGMNHVLKEAPAEQKGNLATYFNPDIPLAKGLMNSIIDFLK